MAKIALPPCSLPSLGQPGVLICHHFLHLPARLDGLAVEWLHVMPATWSYAEFTQKKHI